MKTLAAFFLVSLIIFSGCEKVPTHRAGEIVRFTALNNSAWEAEVTLSQDRIDSGGSSAGGNCEFRGVTTIFYPEGYKLLSIQRETGKWGFTGDYSLVFKKNEEIVTLELGFVSNYKFAQDAEEDIDFPFYPEGPISWAPSE